MRAIYAGEVARKLVMAELLKERPNFLKECKRYQDLYHQDEIGDEAYNRQTTAIFVEKYMYLYNKGNKILHVDVKNYLKYLKTVECKYLNGIQAATNQEEMRMYLFKQDENLRAVTVLNLYTGKLSKGHHGRPKRMSFQNKCKAIRIRAGEIFAENYYEKESIKSAGNNQATIKDVQLLNCSTNSMQRGLLLLEIYLDLTMDIKKYKLKMNLSFSSLKKVGLTLIAQKIVQKNTNMTLEEYYSKVEELKALRVDSKALLAYMQNFYRQYKLEDRELKFRITEI